MVGGVALLHGFVRENMKQVIILRNKEVSPLNIFENTLWEVHNIL
jgi:hypothetical protein